MYYPLITDDVSILKSILFKVCCTVFPLVFFFSFSFLNLFFIMGNFCTYLIIFQRAQKTKGSSVIMVQIASLTLGEGL